MKIYNFDPVTGVFLGESFADADPLENPNGDPNGVWLIPAYATTEMPPGESAGNLRVFRDGAWGYVPVPEAEPDPEPQPPGPITRNAVDAERDRRINAGFAFQGRFYQTRPDDRENIAGAANAAFGAMVLAGKGAGDFKWANPEEDFFWIDALNVRINMDAPTMWSFGLAAMAHKQSHIIAGSDIKKLDPIPEDFEVSPLWPTQGEFVAE